jgi:methylmalonyl-CoA mutase
MNAPSPQSTPTEATPQPSGSLQTPIRIVTAASLFDGHDAAINIMRRILQSSGAEVIHLGHNRSVAEIVDCALQEDAHAIAMTSYQGGHMEFFRYMYDLLQEHGAAYIRIFGGGGGTILPSEVEELHAYGIARIYTPDDGRLMGLQGMIDDLLSRCRAVERDLGPPSVEALRARNPLALGRLISLAENHPQRFAAVWPGIREALYDRREQPMETPNTPLQESTAQETRLKVPVLGITGTGGAGKSSLVDELVRRFLRSFAGDAGLSSGKSIAVISVDPTKRKTGGALLGDRIRMNSIHNPRVYMRSLATRQSNLALSKHVRDALDIVKAVGYDLLILETSGIGQSDTEIIDHSDVCLYVMTPEYGAATQLEKIDMLDFADLIVLNKFDKRGALDALRDVQKQVQRNRGRWDVDPSEMPVYGTMASQFNDPGMNRLFGAVVHTLSEKTGSDLRLPLVDAGGESTKIHIIPPHRTRYLSEISEEIRRRSQYAAEQARLAGQLQSVLQMKELLKTSAAGVVALEGRADLGGHGSATHGSATHGSATHGSATHGSATHGSATHGSVMQSHSAEPSPAAEHSSGAEHSPRQSQTLGAASGAGVHQPTAIAAWLDAERHRIERQMDGELLQELHEWDERVAAYRAPLYRYTVRGKVVEVETHTESLSRLRIPKVSMPRYTGWADRARWLWAEQVPGRFPYTAGVFPFKRENEDPTRMFAGEGGPERTNKRFHYVSLGLPARRLSTAFDSVTLYGEDPDLRPDIYGKIGNSGVSVCCLDDAKKLYSGFDLCDPATSVSMTINGPAPMLLGFFLNAAIDQQCEKYIRAEGLVSEVEQRIKEVYDKKGVVRPRYGDGRLPEGNDGLGLLLLGVTGDEVLPADVYARIKADTLQQVRGTVQADILKEDQAQNTCIFSTEFALRLMGDVQAYFTRNRVRNFYSVSISGYHIAEAGANPITQLAFTLANGFTFVEYYVGRGMQVDDFAPNLSFFFSNGTDPEYAVIGRVARRIWARAMRYRYGGNERSQMLKYHIQTSGRSLHAQEIDFNDIRTTLQALYAIYDNCNSLHTNAYDEAITTPTEESVRRAMAIQLIINHELGLAKNQNPLQGAFIIEELTDLVEEAVLLEFDRMTERGGVLGAMETMYQRNKIQEESMYYEMRKHTGELPIIGVNTFLSSKGSPTVVPAEVIRATEDEKRAQLEALEALHQFRRAEVGPRLHSLQAVAALGDNMFDELMEATKVCSLGQITAALYEVGGQYRRNM